MHAFDTNSGIPYASVDFTKDKGFNPGWSRSATSTSEAASVQLEFNYLTSPKILQEKLSFLTNDQFGDLWASEWFEVIGITGMELFKTHMKTDVF